MIKIVRLDCPYPKGLEDGNYKHPSNKEALKNSSNDKCMYCESKISHIDFAHVEHIKPKDANKYPELEFEWDNLGYSCPKCNNAKSNKFHEDLPYINPYKDDPGLHFMAACPIIFVKNGSERAEITIRDIELNRPSLVEKRHEKLDAIQKSLNACYRTKSESLRILLINELKKEATHDKEYSLCVKSMLELNVA